ncbi:MAG: hypothetical protein HY658_01485 [Actinobacteria bacterium]|nr:hypothetical protein [Actinomycetota bacterium]
MSAARRSSGRTLVGLVALWVTAIGILIGWTWAMFRLFQEGEPVAGGVVGLAMPGAVTLISLLAWATRPEVER